MKDIEIKVGQIWQHEDARIGKRMLKVTKIENKKVFCAVSGKSPRIKPTTCISEREMLEDKRFEFLGDNENCLQLPKMYLSPAELALQQEIDRDFAPLREKLRTKTSEDAVERPLTWAQDIAYEAALERDFGALRKWIMGTDVKN